MEYETIEVERVGRIGVLRLNQPATLNAVSLKMVEEISDGLDDLLDTARAIVLTAAGRAFCSGANLADNEVEDFGASLESHVNPLMLKLRDFPVPWISAVRGAAAGVGCSFALAADLIVASETAYFLQAFSRVGLVPDGGSSYMLARTIGRARAMELMLLGDRLPAAQALEWGLVNRVVPDEALEQAAMDLAERLAAGPQSLGRVRQMTWAALDTPLEDTLRRERTEQADAGRTADCAEGILAFRERRPARFEGR